MTEHDATTPEGGAVEEVRWIVQELDALRSRLREVRAGLPPPPEMEDDLAEEPEGPALLRSTIEAVLDDRLDPALLDLEYAVLRIAGGEAPIVEEAPRPPDPRPVKLADLEPLYDRWARALKAFVFAALRYLGPEGR